MFEVIRTAARELLMHDDDVMFFAATYDTRRSRCSEDKDTLRDLVGVSEKRDG